VRVDGAGASAGSGAGLGAGCLSELFSEPLVFGAGGIEVAIGPLGADAQRVAVSSRAAI
jgi:hypothetical protein